MKWILQNDTNEDPKGELISLWGLSSVVSENSPFFIRNK